MSQIIIARGVFSLNVLSFCFRCHKCSQKVRFMWQSIHGTRMKYLLKPVIVLVSRFHKTDSICIHEAYTAVVCVASDHNDRAEECLLFYMDRDSPPFKFKPGLKMTNSIKSGNPIFHVEYNLYLCYYIRLQDIRRHQATLFILWSFRHLQPLWRLSGKCRNVSHKVITKKNPMRHQVHSAVIATSSSLSLLKLGMM